MEEYDFQYQTDARWWTVDTELAIIVGAWETMHIASKVYCKSWYENTHDSMAHSTREIVARCIEVRSSSDFT
jgi:hypothetical protein